MGRSERGVTAADVIRESGKSELLTEGNDVTIITVSYLIPTMFQVYERLKCKGIRARIMDVPTDKPLDEALLIRCAQETGAIVVCEEQNNDGKLAEAVEEMLTRNYPVPVEFMEIKGAVRETEGEELTPAPDTLSSEEMERKVREVVKRKWGMLG